MQANAHTAPHTQADALFTFEPHTPIAVLVADCVPVLVASTQGPCVAAVHAGWRGTAQKIATHTVQTLVAHGLQASHLVASIGPSIGPCCFHVKEDVAHILQQQYPHAHHAFIPHSHHVAVDLWALNSAGLQEAGLSPSTIHTCKICTVCDIRFFSYRRDQARTGRQAGAIVWNA